MSKLITAGPRGSDAEDDTVVVIQATELEGFKQALIRATAHWQDAPAEILLLKRKLCGDPIIPTWPNPADYKMDLSAKAERKEVND